jgi:RNA 3'-terminal phosphate cyclase (ATP)
MITIDGAYGEGGGQILRTSLALSLVTGIPFRIERIRAGRDKPGLRRQHVTAVLAAAEVGEAEVEGASVDSDELFFRPRHVRPGSYRFAVGTAGSATLVLQTVLPPLLTAPDPSLIELEGGTHNPMAPPYDFIERAFLPLLRRMGPAVAAELDRPGFYPAGGGRIIVDVPSVPRLLPIHLPERGEVLHCKARAVVAGLPRHIAEREIKTVAEVTGWDHACCRVHELPPAYGPGNAVVLEVESRHVTEVFTGVGERGVSAEEVGRRAAREALNYLESGVPVGEHLADQLLLPMALAGGGSFVTTEPTLHTRTNMDIIRRFIDVPAVAEPLRGGAWRITVG